mgnify:CR=1 FL=1
MITKGIITSKSQITIPKAVREAIGLKEGDEVVFIVKDNREIILRKLDKEEKVWLKLAESSFSEWNNPEDEVYDNL